MRALCEDVNPLSTNAPPPWEPPVVTLRNSNQDATQRIPGMSWVEEMDILDPILDNQPSDEAHVMEILPRTGACIMASFRSMANSARRTLWSEFILPKAPVTPALHLDKVYTDSCLKSTKQSDKSLAWVQALMLDAVGLISEALEQLDSAVDSKSKEVELDFEH